MAGHFGVDAGVALLFGILYFMLLCYMTFMYATKRYKWKTRFTVLYLHTCIRVASQACGTAFGVLTWKNTDVFVAYLILGAEGYFSLTIAAYYFLKQFQRKVWGVSYLGPNENPKGKERKMRIFEMWTFLPIFMPWRYWRHDVMAIIDSWLIPANAIIIAGGSILVNVTSPTSTLSEAQKKKNSNMSMIMRTVGQAIFLALTMVYGLFVTHTYLKNKKRGINLRTTLILLTAVSFWLHIRGIFGVLQACVDSLSYRNEANYAADGMTRRFLAIEYALGVLPEFAAATILNMTYWTSAREPWYEGPGSKVWEREHADGDHTSVNELNTKRSRGSPGSSHV